MSNVIIEDCTHMVETAKKNVARAALKKKIKKIVLVTGIAAVSLAVTAAVVAKLNADPVTDIIEA